MPELLTPGVYVQEVDFGPQPIEGVSTSTAGFVGQTEWGLSEGPPTLVTSFTDFQRKFGRFVSGFTLPYAVRGFFENGGRRAYISRVVGTGAGPAAKTFTQAAYNATILSVTPGTNGAVTLSSTVGVTIGSTLDIRDKATDSSTAVLNVTSVSGVTGVVNAASVSSAITAATHYAQILTGPSTNVLTVEARDDGAFGNDMSVLVDAHYLGALSIQAINGTLDQLTLASIVGLAVDQCVEVETVTGDVRKVVSITAINAATRTITLNSALSAGTYVGGRVLPIAWRISVFFEGALVESLTGLSSVVPTSGDSLLLQEVAARSSWIRIASGSGNDDLDPETGKYPAFALGQASLLNGTAGSNGSAPTATEIVGSDVPPRTGLKALEAQDGISIIAAPGETSVTVVGELIGQAERRMDRFAVFESSKAAAVDTPTVAEVLNERAPYNSRYAAMYHPWVNVLDPLTNTQLPMPPSGHVIGCYARTDNDRGVFKAPANVVLRGISGFSADIPNGEQDVLNPNGVNILRNFTGLGNVIWGARTISAEGLWKYVPVRRLFIFLEQSIIRGTRYAVFEPNDPRLWKRLHDSVDNFLTTQWRAGALFGNRAEEAFFVKVDETTTTQDDRDNGIVNILVGIAPVKPAEFVVFQIGQSPTSIIIAERGA